MAINVAKLIVGAPCKRCGCQERWLSNHACVDCLRARLRSPEQRARTRAWYAINKERHKEMRDSWRDTNRAEVRAWNAAYRREHLGLYTAHSRAYTLRKQKAMPTWADRAAIQRFYEERPMGYHVDHIIPLRGKLVSGLHVETNLQYLLGIENNKKGNQHAA